MVKSIKLDEIKQFVYIFEGKLRYKKNNKIIKQRKKGYTTLRINGFNYRYHRILYQLYHNIEEISDVYVVDHLDRNPSNNNIENLRHATFSENCYNTKIRKNNTSGYKGISVVRRGNFRFYYACIKTDFSNHNKLFDYCDEGLQDALSWLKYIRENYHGKFACYG